jgi:predicted ATPase
MILKEIKYTCFEGDPNEWSISGKPTPENAHPAVDFGQINLIVGKNASGKSNTLDSLNVLSDLFTGKLSAYLHPSYSFDVVFEDGNDEIRYKFESKHEVITYESLVINDENKIERKNSKGKIFYEQLLTSLDFENDDFTAAINRSDNIQHPFLGRLHKWGKQLFFYDFGDTLGKSDTLNDPSKVKDKEFGLKRSGDLIAMYINGKEKFKDAFEKSITNDMGKIGYPISKIDVGLPSYYERIGFSGVSLFVKEDNLKGVTHQNDMSQGMFRAFSLLIQLNYCLSMNVASCLVIDDIGEGLDYERSKSLIDLIITKAKNSKIQVFMTTNDRFVMNKIPLEYWSVIHREKNKSIFYNYRNSKEIFDSFAYTGLNNFDFFETEFYLNGFGQPIN